MLTYCPTCWTINAMKNSSTSTSDPYDVPALRRAEDLLRHIAESHRPAKASELLLATGLSKSTMYLLLESLERRRWIERRNGGYIIGLRLFELGNTYLRHDGLQDTFRTLASQFVSQHNEVVQMAVLDAGEVVYIAREDPQRPVRLISDIGTRLPAHCSALGKALLASLDNEAVIALLPATLVPLTERSITSLPELLAALAQVRTAGLATDIEEVAAGLHCFAAYIGTTFTGRRIAVSTSVPIDRIDKHRETQLAVGIVQLAQRLGARSAGFARS